MTTPSIITRLNDTPVLESLIQLNYGATGTGKTLFTASCGDRTLHLDLENRRSTIQSPMIQKLFKYNPIYKCYSEEPVPDIATALDKITKDLYESYDYKDQYDTVVVDGVTGLRKFAMNKGLELNLAGKRSVTLNKMQSLKITPVGKPEHVVPNELGFVITEMNDFTAEMQLTQKFIERVIEYCKGEKKHCIFTAHRRVTYEAKQKPTDADVIKSITPGFTGKTFPDEIIGSFDLIWYFESSGEGQMKEYRALTEGSTSKIAKTCYPGVFKEYEPMTVPNAVNGTKPTLFTDVLRRIKNAA